VDLPVSEAQGYYEICRDLNLKTIFLAAPNTSAERLEVIDEMSEFIYLVSTYGVTGVRDRVSDLAFVALERVKKVCRKPVAVGFGVSRKEHVTQLFNAGADGVVVGSAVLRLIERHKNQQSELYRKIKEFTEELNLGWQ
jgi:tryptophan synthase alpha chain